MESYSLAVALFDFLPVAVSALGLGLLARGIAVRLPVLAAPAWGAALLIPLGGLCKASWKLNVALTGQDLNWLENLLFIALAPGFVAMSFCMFHAGRAWRGAGVTGEARVLLPRLLIWLMLPLAGALSAALFCPHARGWFFWLLGITTVANATLLVHAIRAARWSGLGWPVTACLIYNFAATLALSGLSRLPPGEFTAWIQEGVNLSAQSALALGLWQISRRMRQTTQH